ncbi:poly [ADP-ribose] polymerase tankyrase-2-like [Saccostrea cucullata]|uniref:poly [ADP-ribose] polymerase tankyrase-2-like n=1 Tax=Saccostrea cuccullata TaxID=36930 RepID=UPI002ED0389D
MENSTESDWTTLILDKQYIFSLAVHYALVIHEVGSEALNGAMELGTKSLDHVLQSLPTLQLETQLILIFCTVSLLTCWFTCVKVSKYRRDHLFPPAGSNSMYDWSVFDLAKTAYEPGHTEAVVKLVEQYGYDVNYVMPTNGLSLFLCACLSGRRNLILYMLERGANVNVTTSSGDTSLYLATYGVLNSPQKELEILSDLIQSGCDVNKQNQKGYTPLHRAASKGNIPVIKTLLKHGADPYLCSKSGIYPIDSAITAGHVEAAELLKINVKNPHVWDVVDPHTPPRIQLGLQSPPRRHLMESSRKRSLHKVIT